MQEKKADAQMKHDADKIAQKKKQGKDMTE